MYNKQDYERAFKIGEVIESGAGADRANGACIEILAIEADRIRYKSIRSKARHKIKFPYLQILLDDFESLDPSSIQNSVRLVLKNAGFSRDYSTKNYAYTLAKAFHERLVGDLFLSEGELKAPEDLGNKFSEGGRIAVLIERVERDLKARSACIEHFGATCYVCRFDFERSYGEIGRGFIHVHHHWKKLASSKRTHKVNPIEDLIPLCPNCHAMAHRTKKMLSLKQLRKRWRPVQPNQAN